MKKWMISMTLIRAFLWILSPGALRAEDPATKPWKDAGEVSVVSANGNSKATTMSAKNTFTYAWTKSDLELIGSALGAESQDHVTAEQYLASQKSTWKFTPDFYAYEKFAWDSNRFAGIRHRYDLSGGLGYNILNFPKDKLAGELGAGYVNEERTQPPRNDYTAGRAFAKYTHTFSPTASFFQSGEYLHDFKDSDDYRLSTETAVIASLSTHLSLKASYVWKRSNKPPAGFSKDDTLTAVALLVNY